MCWFGVCGVYCIGLSVLILVILMIYFVIEWFCVWFFVMIVFIFKCVL